MTNGANGFYDLGLHAFWKHTPDWLLESCYVIARVLWVDASVAYWFKSKELYDISIGP